MSVLPKMKIEITIAVVLLLVIAWATFSVAHADNGHGHNHDNGGDVSVDASTEVLNQLGGSSNESWAFAGGNLGDVDIRGCWGSTQFSVFVLFAKQGLKLDRLCVADKYDEAGKHNLAAKMRCTVPEVAALDYDALGTTCEAANKFHVELEPPPPEPEADACCDNDEDDDRIAEVRAVAVVTANDLADLKKSLDRERQARRAYASRAQAEQLAEAKYAQQTLEKLRQISADSQEVRQ